MPFFCKKIRRQNGKRIHKHVYGKWQRKNHSSFWISFKGSYGWQKSFIGQFIKDMKYNETKIEEYFENIEIVQLGLGCFIIEKPRLIDIEKAKKGLKLCSEKMSSGKYDLVILDEIFITTYFKMLSPEEIIGELNKKAKNTEVVMTGRYAPQEIINISDLVTEMKEIKHYYTQGVLSREGFDC